MAQPLLTFGYGSTGSTFVDGAPMLRFNTDWRMGPGWATPGAGVLPRGNFYLRRLWLTVIGGQPNNWALVGHSGPNGDWVGGAVPAGQSQQFTFDVDTPILFTPGPYEYFDCHIAFSDPSISALIGFGWVPAV